MERETFTINIELLEGGRLQVSVPEIDAQVIIDSTRRTDAIDAAHTLIEEHWQKRQLAAASAKAS